MTKLLPLHTDPGVQVGPPVPYIPAAKDMPTLPGPTSQSPLLQAKFVVIRVGGAVAAVADAAPPRLAATSDPVISRALSGERMTASTGRRKRPVSVLAGAAVILARTSARPTRKTQDR